MPVADQRRKVPGAIRRLPLGERVRWARTSAKLSHDRLIEIMGRSNRGHLIKIEKGVHSPRRPLRDSIADATQVPRDLFDSPEDDEEADALSALFQRALAARDARLEARIAELTEALSS